jgi:hypothetical protein
MKVRKGVGVMSKDGVTPWAAGTLHYNYLRDGHMWKAPVTYSMSDMATLIAWLYEGKIESVELIDLNNVKHTYELTAAEKRALSK